MKKNILIIYTNYETGHFMAAKALEEYIQKRNPESNILLLDPLSFSRPKINKLFRSTGKIIATRCRKFRGKLYERKMYRNYFKKSWFFSFCIHLFWTKKLEKKLLELSPSLIISTQVGPTGLIAAHKDLFDAKLISVATDYGIHRMFTVCHEYIDLFCVPTEELKKEMTSLGIDHSKIKITGIPVRQEFTSIQKQNKNNFIKKYHLPTKIPILLFLCGGGLGYDNAFPYFEKLLQSDYEFSYLFIAGRNNSLYKKAKKLTNRYKKKGEIFHYIENIHEMIKNVDLIIGKPGGILTSEALNSEVPMCAIEPIPGQEINNAKFINDHNFGFFITDMNHFQELLEQLKRKEIDLREYRKNIQKNFHKFQFLNIKDL